MEEVPRQVVARRIRNRLIEHMECVLDFESGGFPFNLNELINQWEDWVGSEHPFTADRLASQFAEPVYTRSEVAAVQELDAAWHAFSDATPQIIEDEMSAVALPQWAAYKKTCAEALSLLSKRGKLSEEVII